MSLMTSTPTTEQLEEAVGMIEGLKPKGEWDTMASLGANLSSLQNFMREMDGKATEEEEALAIANAVLAAEGKEEEEPEAAEGEEGEPEAAAEPAAEPAGGVGAGGGRRAGASPGSPRARGQAQHAPREEEVPGGDPGAGAAGARAAGAGGRGVPPGG